MSGLPWNPAQRDEAQQYAAYALEQDVQDAHTQELRLLADVFIRLEQPIKALDLLERIAPTGLLNDDTKMLITCAQRLRRHDLLLRICRELREAGERDYQMQRLELQLLSRYAPEQGFCLAEEFIETSPTPAFFIAFKNVLAIRLNRSEEVRLDATVLPIPADLTPCESQLVVWPYITADRFDDALRFLYAQLRLYFDDERAHAQYVFSFLTYGNRTSLREPPIQVEAESAALLETDNCQQRWVIIEKDRPVPSRGEFAPTSKIAERLLGRNVNDMIELPGSLVHIEMATVKEIQTKYVRAFQDSLSHFRERFPDTSFVQQIHFGTGDEFDPVPLIESLKERRAHIDKWIGLYKAHPCSLHLFANRLGITEIDAIKSLAAHPNGLIKCCQITPSDFVQAVEQHETGNVVVLDITAVVTLTLIEAWCYLDSGKKYIVSQATREVVEQWLSTLKDECSHEGGHASVTEDGQLIFQEITLEQREANCKEIESIKQVIEERCECQSSASLAEIEPQKRDRYEQLVGFHNLEAMTLARDLNAILWCDDELLAFLAKNDFGVGSVWTQLILRKSVDACCLTMDDYNLMSAKLVSWDYAQTIWNPDIVIRAGEYSEWDPQRWPLKQCIYFIAKAGLALPVKARIALDCLKRLRRSSCSEFRQSAVIQTILNAVGNRRAIAWMYNRLDDEFIIDFPSAEFLRPELGYWLKTHLQ